MVRSLLEKRWIQLALAFGVGVVAHCKLVENIEWLAEICTCCK
tara:strand:+ start:764 stop:892 length:129 start_codon:yes stop_codon:yes gene_type:complete